MVCAGLRKTPAADENNEPEAAVLLLANATARGSSPSTADAATTRLLAIVVIVGRSKRSTPPNGTVALAAGAATSIASEISPAADDLRHWRCVGGMTLLLREVEREPTIVRRIASSRSAEPHLSKRPRLMLPWETQASCGADLTVVEWTTTIRRATRAGPVHRPGGPQAAAP
jgi:hypothetical protein